MLMMKIRDVLIGFVVSAAVVGIAVSCGGGGGSSGPSGPATYTVSGALSGATGTIVLKLNGASDISMANGPFTFTTMLASGATYNVQAVDASDRCTVTGGAGTMTAANVTNVAVTCAAPAGEPVVRSTRFSQIVPTAGIARGGVVFDPITNLIVGGVTVESGVTPTSIQLLQAPSGNPTGDTTVPAIATLNSAGDGHTYFIPANTSLIVAGGQIAALSAGELYFQVATATYPAGELRGQINLQGGVLAGVAAMDNPTEVTGGTNQGCTGRTTSGRGAVIVDQATRLIVTSYMTHDVGVNTSASHIHTSVPVNGSCPAGGPTCAGPVIVNFVPGPALTYPQNTTAPLLETPATPNITDFLADRLYFNIHNAQGGCGSGEVRGNIIHIQ
jgi:hypothetical protein